MADFSQYRALVVDDEPDLREITSFELESHGCDVTEAPNGAAAQKVLQEQDPFDFVISDVRMPEGNGIELLEAVIAMPEPRPLVFLVTGFADITREEALSKGAAEMFFKPVDWTRMIEMIHSSLSKSKSA